MTRPLAFFFVLALGLGNAEQAAHAPLKLFLNEVQPGNMSAPQFCTLVYADRRFHTEKADIKRGKDVDRKIYEGQISDNDWNALIAIVDGQQFRDLKVPRTVPPLVMLDAHPYTISVARDHDFQNMEFLDAKALKPYESQVKPLLQWWKSFRGRRTPESNGSADPQCALDSSHAVFAQ